MKALARLTYWTAIVLGVLALALWVHVVLPEPRKGKR